jgi:hypothetical protein
MSADETLHFCEMLKERRIAPEWVERTIKTPERIEDHDDGTRHFVRRIHEFGNRWLRVVVAVSGDSQKRVTAFFDRRLRREHENQG